MFLVAKNNGRLSPIFCATSGSSGEAVVIVRTDGIKEAAIIQLRGKSVNTEVIYNLPKLRIDVYYFLHHHI